MLVPNLQDWAEWKITDETHQFFLLRWEELFSERTYETWQLRTANTMYLLTELQQSAIVTQNLPKHHTHLSSIIDEIELIYKKDIVLKKYFQNIESSIERLKTIYNSLKTQMDHRDRVRKSTKEIYELCAYTKTQISGYLQKVFDDLHLELFHTERSSKKNIAQLLLLLGIELINTGYSKEYIFSSAQLFKSGAPFEDIFQKFREMFDSRIEKYTCYFLIRTDIELRSIPSQDFEVIANQSLQIQEDIKQEFINQDKQYGKIIRLIETGYDYAAAIQNSQNRLERLLSYLNLYSPSKPEVKIYPTIIASANSEDYLFRSIRKSPEYIIDSNKPVDNFEEFTKIIDLVDVNERRYLDASMQFYKLSLSSETNEARFINLWISLETMFQDQDGSVIEELSKYVPIILSVNYLNEILRSIAKDLFRYWKRNAGESLKEFCLKPNKRMLHPYDLLRILLLPDDHELYNQTLGLCQSNPLLRFRLFNLRNGLLKSHSELRKRLKRHNQNIIWQIKRIYRVRNRIVHQGSGSEKISQFYQHLYSYYVNTVHYLVKTLKSHPDWTISMCLNSIRYQYLDLIELLEKNKPISISIMQLYRMDLSESNDALAWENV